MKLKRLKNYEEALYYYDYVDSHKYPGRYYTRMCRVLGQKNIYNMIKELQDD